MALHTHLPIYKATYNLLREVVKASRNMPKDVKQAVGNVLRDECIGVSLMIYRANVSQNKESHMTDQHEKVLRGLATQLLLMGTLWNQSLITIR